MYSDVFKELRARGIDARANLIRSPADRVAAVLAAGTRSDGRQRNRLLDGEQVARRVEHVCRRVLSDG